MTKLITMVQHQLIGFVHRDNGGSLLELVDAMGLTNKEFDEIKGVLTLDQRVRICTYLNKYDDIEVMLQDEALEDTYWGKAILKAAITGRFTRENKNKAGRWMTCACGETTHNFRHGCDYAPDDDELRQLGCDFNSLVKGNYINRSAEVLVSIEKRAYAVMKENL